MIKKIMIAVLALLLCMSTNVLAGDTPEEIMLGKQKALFIGRITAINADTYNIAPITIMMGEIQQQEIQIEKFNMYSGTKSTPKNGDFVVAILLWDNKIDNSWVFKSTTEDYKTLKLVVDRPLSGPSDVVFRYQEYINQGKYIEAQKLIDEKRKSSISSIMTNTDSQEAVQDKEVPNKKNNKSALPLTLLGAAVILLIYMKKISSQ